MRLWHGLLVIMLLVALPVMSGCVGGSKISADEAIAIVKQHEREEGFYAPPPAYWYATHEGKGKWLVYTYIDVNVLKEEDPELLARYKIHYLNPYLWHYYEKSGIIESIGGDERQKILEELKDEWPF